MADKIAFPYNQQPGTVDYIAIGYFILVSIKINYFILGKKNDENWTDITREKG